METKISEIISPASTGLFSNTVLGPFVNSLYETKKEKDWKTQYKILCKTFLKNVNVPYVVYMGTNSIDYLENSNTIIPKSSNKKIKKYGLTVYLLEALSTYHINYKDKSLYAEYEFEDTDNIRSRELDSIEIFLKRNNLKKIKVYCPNYKANEIFSKRYPNLDIKCLPIGWIFPATLTVPHNIDVQSKSIDKHFWIGNWRYSTHRHIIASYIADNYLEKSYMSWIYESTSETLIKNLWTDLNNFDNIDNLINGANKLGQLAPLTMDIKVNALRNLDNLESLPAHQANPSQYYQKSFCAVITETRFAEYSPFLTEKTLNAIINKRPFIMVGPPGNLDYMKKWGWKTFNRWFDESYDNERCHYKRIQMILERLDYIASLSIEECRIMYTEMKDVLDYNYNFILELQEGLLAEPITNNKYFKRVEEC